MYKIRENKPRAIRVWVVSGIIHASIPRTVVRAPVVINHRRDTVQQRPSNRERYDLALNMLNCLVLPQRAAKDACEPVKCFRGECSAFAARYHCDFARDFLFDFRDGREIEVAEIERWIERRRRLATEELGDTESYVEALRA